MLALGCFMYSFTNPMKKVLPSNKGTQLSLVGEITFHQVSDD